MPEIKQVQRFDFGRMDKAEVTPNGFMNVPIRITRIGVLDYGSHKEYRPAEEVFADDSLASLARIPFTNEHPFDGVTTSNAKQTAVGFVSDDIEVENEEIVKGSATVFDKETILEIQAGAKREISAGYTTNLEMTAGVFNGQAYDAIQRNIRYNHVALVERGRAGRKVRVMMDKEGNQILESAENDQLTKTEDEMAVIKLNGKSHTVSSGLAEDINALLAKLKDAKKKGDSAEEGEERTDGEVANAILSAIAADASKKLDAVETLNTKVADQAKELEALQGKLDAKSDELKNATDAKKFDAAVQARIELLDKARTVVKDGKFEGKADIDVMKEVLVAVNKDVDLEGKSVDYIAAKFDTTIELGSKATETRGDGGAGKKVLDQRGGGKDEDTRSDAEKAMDEYESQRDNAYKGDSTKK